jgi:uncharacterized iron-regulated membrane protein
MSKSRTRSERPARTHKKPFLSPQFVKAMLAGHSALGLAFAALIYIVCLTGTVAVFVQELHRWEQPNASSVQASLRPEAINEAVWAGYGQALIDKAADDLILIAPNRLSPRFLITYHSNATGEEGEWIADADGHLRTRVRAPWADFIGTLHMTLHLPRTWGLFLVGLTGVALLASLISGLLSHPRIFKDAFALRWGGSKRLQEADLHNRLSVWGLPFHFIVSLTGALLGLSTLIVGVLALAAYDGDSEKAFAAILGPRATPGTVAGPVPDVAAMIATVQRQRPEAEFVSAVMQHIGTAGQIVHLGMKSPGHLALANTYYFDGSGKLIGDGGFEEGGVGQQILGVLQPLHFGWFGGIGTKIVYGIIGLALTVIAQSGVAIWLARCRDNGRPAPVWERIWSAVVWGQVLALGLSAIASLRFDEQTLTIVYYAAVSVCLALAVGLRDELTVRRSLQAASAIVLALLVLLYLATWWTRMTDAAAVYVTAAIAVLSIVLACFAFADFIKIRSKPTVQSKITSEL